MVKIKKQRTLKQRAADRRRLAVHSATFVWQDVERDYVAQSQTTACGKRRFQDGRVVAIHSFDASIVTCAACVRLLAMTRAEYLAHVTAEATKLQDVRKWQGFCSLWGRLAVRAERAKFVDEHRDDALVALDAYLSGDDYPRMSDVLSAALTLYKMQNPTSRGDNLVVFDKSENRTTPRTARCRFCRCAIGSWSIADGMSRAGRIHDLVSGDIWPTWERLREHCEKIGANYDDDAWRTRRFVEPERHVTLCALAYLSGTKCVESLA